jgi:hypothetical protein
MRRKTVTGAVTTAVLTAAAAAVFSTSALAQSPGEGEEIVVSSEVFEAVTAWLGDLEENPTFKDFLAESEDRETVKQWFDTVQKVPEYVTPQQFLRDELPARAAQLEEFAADEGWNYADPQTLALHMLAADEDLFDRWEQRVALKRGLGIADFAQARALPEFTKWRSTLRIPADTVPLDNWLAERGLKLNLPPRPDRRPCNCMVLVNFAGSEPQAPLQTSEVIVDNKKDKQKRWTKQFMAAHRAEVYIYARGHRRGLDKETLHRTNTTAIRFVNLCLSFPLRPCQGCITTVHPYARYAARVHAHTNTWGLFGGKSEAGATDAVQLKLDTGTGKLTLIDKGVAIAQTSEQKFKLDEIKAFVQALAAFAKFDIGDAAATAQMVADLVVAIKNLFEDWKSQSDNSKDMLARYDAVLSEDPEFLMPPNRWWTLELISDGTLAYSGEGRHETNTSWYASGAGLAVGLEGFICPVNVGAPGRVGAWAHSQVESSPFFGSTTLQRNLAAFLATVMFAPEPDTSANTGVRPF